MKALFRGLLILMALAFAGAPAFASNCSSYTYTLTNGTTADANQVMSNFNNILNCANNNLAHNGANSDITSLTGLTTPIPVTEGGTGLGTLTSNAVLLGNGTSTPNLIGAGWPGPQGRLTLQSGTPVMTANETAQTTIYYDTYIGNMVPFWNGTYLNFFPIVSNETSMGLDSGVPHITSGDLYDIFAVNNSGTVVICAGPAWTSSTARGTGAGTTQISLTGGIWTNTNSLTHCWGGASGTTDYGAVAATAGTYLGTFYATANGQTGMAFTASGSGGGGNILGLWNAYNRVAVIAYSTDSASDWTIASATFRAADSSTSNAIKYVDGLAESFVFTSYQAVCAPNGTAVASGCIAGAQIDWSSGAPTYQGALYDASGISGGAIGIVSAQGGFLPVLGFHTIQAVEAGFNTTPVAFYGTGLGPVGTDLQFLSIQLMM